jgi:hypothetical protein
VPASRPSGYFCKPVSLPVAYCRAEWPPQQVRRARDCEIRFSAAAVSAASLKHPVSDEPVDSFVDLRNVCLRNTKNEQRPYWKLLLPVLHGSERARACKVRSVFARDHAVVQHAERSSTAAGRLRAPQRWCPGKSRQSSNYCRRAATSAVTGCGQTHAPNPPRECCCAAAPGPAAEAAAEGMRGS